MTISFEEQSFVLLSRHHLIGGTDSFVSMIVHGVWLGSQGFYRPRKLTCRFLEFEGFTFALCYES